MLLVVDARFVSTYWMLLGLLPPWCQNSIDRGSIKRQFNLFVEALIWGGSMMVMLMMMISFQHCIYLWTSLCTCNVLTHMHFCCVRGVWGVGICYYPSNLRTHVINGPFKRQKEHLKSLKKSTIAQTDSNLKSIASEYLAIHRSTQTQTYNRYMYDRPDPTLAKTLYPVVRDIFFWSSQPSSQWPVVF